MNPNLIDFYRNLISPHGSGFGGLYAMLEALGVEVAGDEQAKCSGYRLIHIYK